MGIKSKKEISILDLNFYWKTMKTESAGVLLQVMTVYLMSYVQPNANHVKLTSINRSKRKNEANVTNLIL